RNDGAVLCWGLNTSGQCGLDVATANVLAPTLVAGLTDAREVISGEYFNCARRGDGTVWCWGNNDVAQLGDGPQFTARPTPAPGASALPQPAQNAAAAGPTGPPQPEQKRAPGSS